MIFLKGPLEVNFNIKQSFIKVCWQPVNFDFCFSTVILPIGRHQLPHALIFTRFSVIFSRQLGGFAWYLSCSIDPSRGRRHDHLDGRTPTRQTWLHRPALLPTAILYCLTEEFTEWEVLRRASFVGRQLLCSWLGTPCRTLNYPFKGMEQAKTAGRQACPSLNFVVDGGLVFP